jgi:protein SCO1
VSIASPNLPQTGGSDAAAESARAEAADVALRPSEPTSRAIPDAGPRENALQRTLAGLFGRRLFWVLFLLVAFSWPISRVIHRALPPKLPVLGTIAAFTLVDQEGRPFGTAELEGRVWVASAVRTSSPAAVDLVKELGKIQHRVRNLGPAFRLVTIGVDPVGDTPDRMMDFTSHHRVSPRIWSFLSGEPATLRRAQSAIGLDVGVPDLPTEPHASAPRRGGARALPSESADGPLAVAVVDGKMRVRGRYDLADPSAIDTLLYHVGLLINRGD